MPVHIEVLPLGPVSANCYIVTDKATGRIAVIDPAAYHGTLKALLADRKVNQIWLTHGHFDHFLGAAALKQETGAVLCVHADDAGALTDETTSLADRFLGSGKQTYTEPDRLLHDGDVLQLGDTKALVLHTPGHSPGGICLQMDGVLFSGDTLFSGGIGRTDGPGANRAQMADSLGRLAALHGVDKVYPGHGPATTLAAELTVNPWLRGKESP